MRDFSFGVPVINNTQPFADSHEPRTVEVSSPHALLTGLGPEYGYTRRRCVTVAGYGEDGKMVAYHHVTKLPGKLGNAATQLMTSAWVSVMSLRV
jgi:hypothetical protein